MMRGATLALVLGLLPGLALAGDLGRTAPPPRPADLLAGSALPLMASPMGLRPVPRPADLATYGLGQVVVMAPPKGGLRPLPRPADLLPPLQMAITTPPDLSAPQAPPPRPASLNATTVASAAPAPVPQETPVPPKKGGLLGGLFSGPTAKSAKTGYVCGDPEIKGIELAPIASSVPGCGVPEPVRVTSVAGMPLTNAATINCETAKALKSWVNKGVRPAFGQDRVQALVVIDSYACRPRNNVRGAKISEHGRGKAIDIGGLKMADGSVLTVLHDFNRQMRQAYRAGCGIFGTTLGPGSDGFHENHMHFDTARQRGGGSYCR